MYGNSGMFKPDPVGSIELVQLCCLNVIWIPNMFRYRNCVEFNIVRPHQNARMSVDDQLHVKFGNMNSYYMSIMNTPVRLYFTHKPIRHFAQNRKSRDVT